MSGGPETAWIVVGRVGRPHGRNGAFVVERPSEHPERFAEGSELYLDRVPVTVISSMRSGGRLVVKLNIAAERGAELALPRAELPALAELSYYVVDLVGLDVVTDEGVSLGPIADVLPLPANDVIELENGQLIPLVRACVLDVDLESRRLVIARSFAVGG